MEIIYFLSPVTLIWSPLSMATLQSRVIAIENRGLALPQVLTRQLLAKQVCLQVAQNALPLFHPLHQPLLILQVSD